MGLLIDCVSDLHGETPEMMGGDLLIVAGDCTANNSVAGWQRFGFWIHAQKYKYKVWIAGNHDGGMNIVRAREFVLGAHYLEDSGIEIEGVKIWGSPWTPEFGNWHFMKKRGQEIREVWDKIPEGIDILVTHGPPYGTLDVVNRGERQGRHVGCEELAEAVKRIKPKLHVFGHIHAGYGAKSDEDTYFINCAQIDEDYEPTNEPIRVIFKYGPAIGKRDYQAN